MLLSEFQFFQLPLELRLKIWDLARPPATVIHTCINTRVDWGPEGPFFNDCSHASHLVVLNLLNKTPSLLHVCRESRAFVLRTYTTSFDITRSCFPRWPSAAERPYDGSPFYNMFSPCYHEFLVSNKNKTIYWDPENDIIFYHGLRGPVVDDTFLSETAFIWSYHGYSVPLIQDVKNLALKFDLFGGWILGRGPVVVPFGLVKTVYVILTRRKSDGDDIWGRHKTRFMCWYQQLKTNNPGRFAGERKVDFDLKIVQSIEGVLEDGAFEAAVPEDAIGGWKDDPNSGTWGDDEDSWRDGAQMGTRSDETEDEDDEGAPESSSSDSSPDSPRSSPSP